MSININYHISIFESMDMASTKLHPVQEAGLNFI